MHYSVHTFELRQPLSHEQKYQLLDRFYNEGGYRIFTKGNETIICKFESQGIRTVIMDNPFRPYIAFQISLNTLLNGEYVDLITYQEASLAIQYSEIMITEWLGEKYIFNELYLCRVDLCVNVDVGSPENVTQYIRQLYKTNMRRSFKIRGLKNPDINKNAGFTATNEDEGLELAAYNKKHQLEAELGIPAQEHENILRIEFRLKKESTIDKFTNNSYSNDEKIIDLIQRSKNIMLAALPMLLPDGDYYKLNNAIDIVHDRIKSYRLRDCMELILRLTADKHGLKSARKAMRKAGVAGNLISDAIAAFNDIGVNPVTLKKNAKVKFLPSLYKYLN